MYSTSLLLFFAQAQCSSVSPLKLIFSLRKKLVGSASILEITFSVWFVITKAIRLLSIGVPICCSRLALPIILYIIHHHKNRSIQRTNTSSKLCNNTILLFCFHFNLNIYNLQQIMSSRTFSQSRREKSQSYHERDNRIHSEVRRRQQSESSRSRSRDDNKSVRSGMSQKSNRSGPVVFGGNTVIKKTEKVEDQTSEILSRAEFRKPIAKTKNIRDRDLDDEYAAWGWQQAEKNNQQEWYQREDDAYEEQAQRKKLYETEKMRSMQAQLEQRLKGSSHRTRMDSRQRMEENVKWQETQLINSGIFRMTGSMEDEDHDQKRVMLMVHDLKPPFLDGNIAYTTQMSQIQVVKDPLSDMAILAKKGSTVVKELRQRNERQRAKQKQEADNERLKKLFQKKENEKEGEQGMKLNEQGEADYKDGAKFSSLLSGKRVAATDFSRNKTLKQQRQMLPVFEVRDQIRKVIRQNKVVIIVGETGSGKTTQMTQYLLQDGYGKYGIIGCTQPRRVAAVSVAKRVSQEMNNELGSIVGYSIRFQDCTSNQTIIKYMTDGVLLRESLNDDELQMYSAIIMDEAHERSLNTDVLFGILKKVAQKRRDIKIIITSATMNAEKFSAFFGNAPIFQIPGRIFPVQKYFQKAAVTDYVDAAVKKAVAIHLQQPPGDILIFMTGQEDIECTCRLIQQKLDTLQNAPKLLILPIYSQLRSQQQAKIFQSSELRKCIVATNIAQTSLTLDGVKYVIDTGFCKLKVYNPRIGMDALQITPISQANANQRAGRAGRTGPGHCYRLYSAHIFRQDLFENNIPEIQRTNLCNVVLLLKSLNIDNLLEFDFMDPPPQDTILSSMYQLWVLGALDNLGHLTPLGRKMAEFPVDPPLSKMIIVSNDLECLSEVITIVSMLSVPSIFYKPKDQMQEAESAREKLLIPQSDHLTYLNIYQQWKKHNFSAEWCRDHFLQFKSLKKVGEVRSQLMDIAKELGFKMTSCEYNYDLVRKAVCSGYFINAAKVKGIGDYVNMRTGVASRLHMSSALLCLGQIPEYVVYHELVMTSREYMNCVTMVDPHWLAEMGPMFFSIKSDLNKSKADIDKEGQSFIFKQIEEAKRKKEEMEQKREREQQKQRNIRMGKANFVVQAGKGTKSTPRTQWSNQRSE